METLVNVLHVVGAVFIVGPMAILPMSAMRAIRARNAAQVGLLARSTNLFSLLSLLVVVLGFALMGMTDPKEKLSMTTPWILISLILYVIAIALSLAIVVPTLRRAAADLESAGAAPAGAGAAVPRHRRRLGNRLAPARRGGRSHGLAAVTPPPISG
jgi:uncharacterized membrane protein